MDLRVTLRRFWMILALGLALALLATLRWYLVAPASSSQEYENYFPPPLGSHFAELAIKARESTVFTLESNLEVSPEGLSITRDGNAVLSGVIRDTKIDSIEVNGQQAVLDTSPGTWTYTLSAEHESLLRGINRVTLRAYSGKGGDRKLVGQRSIDIHFEGGAWREVHGTLPLPEPTGIVDHLYELIADRPPHTVTWKAEDGPYHIIGDVIVPPGHRLIIEPGSTLFFDGDTTLTVHGELIAAGSEYRRIYMGSTPGQDYVEDIRPELPLGPPHWGGVQYRGTLSPHNQIAKAVIVRAQSIDGSIGIHESRLHIDDVSISGTREFMIYTFAASLLVENCIFDDMFGADESPLKMTPPIDNTAEPIKGRGKFPENGHYIIRNNYFGTNRGHNDIIDVDSNQYPAPVLQILNNYFVGVGDEAIDGGGDILVDGNIFRNVIKDRDNDGDGEANVISTGDTLNTVLVMTRNIFLDIDHVVNFKKGAYGYFENNTVVGITPPHMSLDTDPPPRLLDFSVINFLIPDWENPRTARPRDPAGLGAYTSGNIYADVPQAIFGNPDLNPIEPTLKGRLKFWLKSMRSVSALELNKSLIESPALVKNADQVHGRNFDYVIGKPLFRDADKLDFRLRTDSPGYQAGPNGIDMGGMVPAGASISGEPDGISRSRQVTLTIGGPGIFSYQYRVNDGPWSDEVEISDPSQYGNGPVRREATLELDGLSDGDYTVYVRGRNFAGELQPEHRATQSKRWTVNAEGPR